MPSQLKRKGVDEQSKMHRVVKRQHADSIYNQASSYEGSHYAKPVKVETEVKDENILGNIRTSHSPASQGDEARPTIELPIKREQEDSAPSFYQAVTPESCNEEAGEKDYIVAAGPSESANDIEMLARQTTPLPKDEASPGAEKKKTWNVFPEASQESRYQQHWRRSAAPSPSTSRQQHLPRMAQRRQEQQVIGAQDLGDVLLQVLIPSSLNPNRCSCGWYQFYSLCGHLCRTLAFKCGARQSRSRVPAFCASPAPRHNVETHVIEQACTQCAHSET